MPQQAISWTNDDFLLFLFENVMWLFACCEMLNTTYKVLVANGLSLYISWLMVEWFADWKSNNDFKVYCPVATKTLPKLLLDYRLYIPNGQH